MTDTKPSQKEEAFAFAKEHGFTISLETIERRTYYRADRSTGSVDSQGYSSLTVRMRKHLESIGELAPKVFPKTQSRAAAEAAHVRDQPKILPVALNWKAPANVELKTTDVSKVENRQLAAYAEGLRGLNTSAPVVMIFDDIHAASEDTPETRAAFQRWQHDSNSMPRRAHYRKRKAVYRPWVVYAGLERIKEFALRSEAVTCVRRFLSDNAIIKASVGAMEIRFERG